MLGPYTLLSKLGEGGMGEVHLARDPKLDREVALKLLPAELRAEPERRSRFLREARAVAKLSHPNVTQIFEIGEVDGQDFIAFEYVEGATLRDVIAQRQFSLEEIAELALPLADAIQYAHERGVIHRDIKPANVMIDERGHPKLLDFGLAKVLGPTRNAATTLTAKGAVFGTPSAMSPEQGLGRAVDVRSDVFSFGSLLYEMSVRRPAFFGGTAGEVIDAVIHDEPTPVDKIRPELPRAFASIVEKALRKDPRERYQTMSDLAADLRYFRRATESGLEPPKLRRMLSPRRGLFAVAVVALLATAWFGVQSLPHSIDRVAVLPLDNLTGDDGQQYLVDGIHDALIGELGKLDEVTVLSRSSVMRFRETDKPAREIAGILGVDALIEGAVFRSGETFRVSVQLVDAQTGAQLWAESYEGDRLEAFGLHREMARSIVDAVRGKLAPEAGEPTPDPPPTDPSAEEAYRRAHFHLTRLTPAGLDRAVQYFEEAVGFQDAFARAHSGLAAAQCLKTLYDAPNLSREELFAGLATSRSSADRALELDPSLAEAHAVRAYAAGFFPGRAHEALDGLNRAVALDASNALAHDWMSDVYLMLGRPIEAVDASQRARELEPLGPVMARDLGFALFFAGRYEEAVESLRYALELEPDLVLGRLYLVQALVLLEHFDEAWDEQRAELLHLGASEGLLQEASEAFARDGWEGAVERLIDASTDDFQSPTGNPKYIFLAQTPELLAVPLAYLGRTDAALTALERAAAARSPSLVGFTVHPMLAALRDEPRFRAVARELGVD